MLVLNGHFSIAANIEHCHGLGRMVSAPLPAALSQICRRNTMPLTPIQEVIFERWLRKRLEPVLPRKRQIPSKPKTNQNPKWTDDTWFEKRYGDPDITLGLKGFSDL
jgi:hypothetical protein